VIPRRALLGAAALGLAAPARAQITTLDQRAAALR
jgi:hypothetical protein